MKTKIQFEEEQSFVGKWPFYLVIAVAGFAIGGAAISYIQSDASDGLTGIIITILVLGAVIWLLSVAKLELIVDQQHVYYRYVPFINNEKKVSREDISSIYVRRYNPISEYGGWGVRGFAKNKALNVSGNKGLQLIFKNGKKLLIGTSKAEDLERVIKQLKENWGMNG